MTTLEKIEILERDFKKEYKKYFKAMSYRIMSIEIEALYNVLVLNKESKYELTRRWENNVRNILKYGTH